PSAAGPAGRVLVHDGSAYRAEDGVEKQRDRLKGATVGVGDLDLAGLLLTARSNEASIATAAARDGAARLALGETLGTGAGSSAQGTATRRYGSPTYLHAPPATFSP